MPYYDLCVIRTGSGNSIVDDRFAGLRVAMLDDGVRFGGTCLNVGCIPTKMFVLPADAARTPGEAARLGVHLDPATADWPAIRDRIFGRIDLISAGGEAYRAHAPTSPSTAPRAGSSRRRPSKSTATPSPPTSS